MHEKGLPKIKARTLKFAKKNKLEMNTSEVRMWMILKSSPYNFRRQYVIGSFIVDFASLEKKIVIEVDGISHDDKARYDIFREQKIINQGYKILRFIGFVPFPGEQEIHDFVWMKIGELEKSDDHMMMKIDV